MTRERVLQVVLVLFGLLFVAGIYPLIDGVRHPTPANYGETMMMSLYVTLGVFLLMAVRNPSNHRGVIAFAAWSSFAHAVTMVGQAMMVTGGRRDFLIASTMFTLIGVVLVALSPARKAAKKEQAVTV